MDRFKNHPISTFLGLIFISLSGVLLFVPTLYEVPLYALGIIAVSGILLIFSKDKLLDILTLGLSRLLSDSVNKFNPMSKSIPGGGVDTGKKDDDN